VQTDQETIAFLISAYNAEPYIVGSVRSALDQTYPNVVVWVIDDGSTDQTWDRLLQFDDERLHLRRRQNRGKPASMNELLDCCDAPYFAMQDADDISLPNRAERLVATLSEDPDLALVLSGYTAFFEGGQTYRISRRLNPADAKRLVDEFQMPSHDPTMGGRVASARVVRFDEHLRGVEGVDFVWRTAETEKIAVLPDVLYQYRIHDQSTTRSGTVSLSRSMATVYGNALSRRTGLEFTESEILDRFGIRHDASNNLWAIQVMAVQTALQEQDRRTALRVGLESLRNMRRGVRYIKPLAIAIRGLFIRSA
jgi:glycosyltransferase involved in cell wall biosynthesis